MGSFLGWRILLQSQKWFNEVHNLWPIISLILLHKHVYMRTYMELCTPTNAVKSGWAWHSDKPTNANVKLMCFISFLKQNATFNRTWAFKERKFTNFHVALWVCDLLSRYLMEIPRDRKLRKPFVNWGVARKIFTEVNYEQGLIKSYNVIENQTTHKRSSNAWSTLQNWKYEWVSGYC